jgi:hypothetical protein
VRYGMMMNAARSVLLLIGGTFNPLADASSTWTVDSVTWKPSLGGRRTRHNRLELWADLCMNGG